MRLLRHRLAGQAGELVDVNQITEVPPAQAEVIEVRQYAVTCPACGQTVLAQPPAGLEMSRSFGARLESLVVYYRQEQHMSYERTQTALWNLHGVAISQGGIDQISNGPDSKRWRPRSRCSKPCRRVRSSTVTRPVPASTVATGGNGSSVPLRRSCTSSNPVAGRMSSRSHGYARRRGLGQ